MPFTSWPPPPPSSGSSSAATGLASTGAPIDVSGAPPPVAGQVLTGIDDTHAQWRVPGLKYDAAIRFNADALGQATIEPNTWGFVQTAPVGSSGVTIFVVSSLTSPPVDSRFGLYISPSLGKPVTVSLIGASQIMGIDGALASSVVLALGGDYEWVFYHEGGAAIWGLVSFTAPATRIAESSGPTTLNIGAIASGQFLQRSGTSIIGNVPATALDAFPYLKPHPSQTAQSDEFDAGSPDLATRGWTIRNLTDGVNLTRIGEVDPLSFGTPLTANQYNSSLRGSVLLLELPAVSKIYMIYKPFTANAGGGYFWGRVTLSGYQTSGAPSNQILDSGVLLCGSSGGFPSFATDAVSSGIRCRSDFNQTYSFRITAGSSNDAIANAGGTTGTVPPGLVYPIRGVKYDVPANRKVAHIHLLESGEQMETVAPTTSNVPVIANLAFAGVFFNINALANTNRAVFSIDFLRFLNGLSSWII